MSIALFGGAFNPIHNGHLSIAKLAYQQKNIDKLFFIPSNLSVHKSNLNLASNEDRLNMLKLALEETNFFYSDIEIKRGGDSYTIDTVLDFKKLINPSEKIFFICGQDILNILPTFKNIDILKKLVTFLVFSRGEKSIDYSDYNVEYIDIPTINISSSIIRDNIKKGEDCSSLVPLKVLSYIKEKKLYI